MSNEENSAVLAQTFEVSWNPLAKNIRQVLDVVSENRRPYVERRVANSLLFRCATSFIFHNRAPHRNESALNEALSLRASALEYYKDDEDRLKGDIEGIVAYFSPDAPVTMKREAGSKKDPMFAEIDAELADDDAKISKEVAREREYIAGVLPYLEGFLGGASYDHFDIQGSELAGERARMAAVAAASAIADRVERDTILCGTNLKAARNKFELSNTFDNKQSVAHWFAEYKLAKDDRTQVGKIIKSVNLQPE